MADCFSKIGYLKLVFYSKTTTKKMATMATTMTTKYLIAYIATALRLFGIPIWVVVLLLLLLSPIYFDCFGFFSRLFMHFH